MAPTHGKVAQRMLDALLWWKIRDPRRRARLSQLAMHLHREQNRGDTAPDPSGLLMLEPSALRSMRVEELVQRFRALAIAKDEADGIGHHERLYWQLDAVVNELEHHEGDARHALLPLYTDPDIRIRAEAAGATRELAPELARDRLLALDDAGWSAPTSGGGPRRSKLQDMDTEQLVERFVALALEQDDALLKDQIPRFNRLYGLMDAVENELEARVALLPLLTHPNPMVRLKAATAVLAVAPHAARETLQAIVERKEYPQAAEASGVLRSLDERRHQQAASSPD
jgi:hypothetical protein